MKAYKLEILVIDHDEVGPEELKHMIENARYPNRCISPEVKAIEERDIGEWSDGHPLNFNNQAAEEYYRELFLKNKPKGEEMAEIDFQFENGQKAQSKVSGFVGVITSRSQCLYGCHRYFISPSVDKDGKLPVGYWFDEPELEVIEETAIEHGKADRGGPPSMIK